MLPKRISGTPQGERVWVKDLIEDFIGATWNQGNVYRLEAAEAVWNGEELEIQYDHDSDIASYIG